MTKTSRPAVAHADTYPIARHAPGLDATQGQPNGGMDFWAPGSYVAPRQYRDDHDGWQTIRRKPAKKQRRGQ
jgi:hypothetical protein